MIKRKLPKQRDALAQWWLRQQDLLDIDLCSKNYTRWVYRCFSSASFSENEHFCYPLDTMEDPKARKHNSCFTNLSSSLPASHKVMKMKTLDCFKVGSLWMHLTQAFILLPRIHSYYIGNCCLNIPYTYIYYTNYDHMTNPNYIMH